MPMTYVLHSLFEGMSWAPYRQPNYICAIKMSMTGQLRPFFYRFLPWRTRKTRRAFFRHSQNMFQVPTPILTQCLFLRLDPKTEYLTPYLRGTRLVLPPYSKNATKPMVLRHRKSSHPCFQLPWRLQIGECQLDLLYARGYHLKCDHPVRCDNLTF